MRLALTTLALGTLVAAVPAQAQWAALTPASISNNGGEYWDNQSSDGRTCNIGYVLTGGASTSCGAQRPTGWLPYTGPAMAEYHTSRMGFPLFTENLSGMTIRLYGDIAGQNTEWGIFNAANRSAAGRVNLNAAYGATVGVRTGVDLGLDPSWSSWGFYIRDTHNTYHYSDVDQQFAFFRNASGEFALGMEDIYVGSSFNKGDRDYNDVLVTFSFAGGSTQVPEPGTFALAGLGLVGLIGAARRRRLNA